MEPLEISHCYYDGYHWSASSPDLKLRDGSILVGGGDTYEKSKAEVESMLRWSLEDESLEFTHCVQEDSIQQYLAEREAAAKQQTAV